MEKIMPLVSIWDSGVMAAQRNRLGAGDTGSNPVYPLLIIYWLSVMATRLTLTQLFEVQVLKPVPTIN